jgi:hypothetical protein
MRRAAATALALCLAAPSAWAADPPDPLGDLIARTAQGRAAEPARPQPEPPARKGRDRRAAAAKTDKTPVSTALTLATLRGLSDAAVKARLGAPQLERAEGAGALWTYRLRDCALLVFLVDQGGLKVVGAEASPLVRGGPVPAVDACLAGASAA